MTLRFACLAVVACLLCASMVSAAELGRQSFGKDSATKNYEDNWLSRKSSEELGMGLEFGVDYTAAEWDVGDESYDTSTPSFQATYFYAVNPVADIRATAKFMNLDDERNAEGMEPDVRVIRLGVGTRLWFGQTTDLHPYAGATVNYYAMNGEDIDSIKGGLGLAAEAGVAYVVNDAFAVRAGLQAETTVLDAEGDVGDGESADISLSAVGFGVGVVFVF